MDENENLVTALKPKILKIGNKEFTTEENDRAKVLCGKFRTVKSIQDFFSKYGFVFGNSPVISVMPETESVEIMGGITFVASIVGFTVSVECQK